MSRFVCSTYFWRTYKRRSFVLVLYTIALMSISQHLDANMLESVFLQMPSCSAIRRYTFYNTKSCGYEFSFIPLNTERKVDLLTNRSGTSSYFYGTCLFEIYFHSPPLTKICYFLWTVLIKNINQCINQLSLTDPANSCQTVLYSMFTYDILKPKK